MPKEDHSNTHKVLVLFASLNAADRERFMSSMHEYLLASPQGRRALVQAWQRELNCSAKT